MTYKPKPLNTFSQENWKKLYIPHSALPTVLYRGIKFDDKSFVTYPLNGDLTIKWRFNNASKT